MKTNLVPPLIVREDGIQVNDTPKIQVENPSEEYHYLYFPKSKLFIILSLCGIILYFNSYKPTPEFINDSEVIYLLTPSTCNYHHDAYASNE